MLSFVRPRPQAFFRPDRRCPTPTRAEAVKAGRRSDLKPHSDVSRPRLDSLEHGGRLDEHGPADGKQLAVSVIPPSCGVAFSRSSVDVHGSCDQSHHLISGSSVTACHSAACTDDRVSRMGLIFTAADWRGQICDGFRQPHIRPAQHPHLKERRKPLACHLAFSVVGGLRIAPCGTKPCST